MGLRLFLFMIVLFSGAALADQLSCNEFSQKVEQTKDACKDYREKIDKLQSSPIGGLFGGAGKAIQAAKDALQKCENVLGLAQPLIDVGCMIDGAGDEKKIEVPSAVITGLDAFAGKSSSSDGSGSDGGSSDGPAKATSIGIILALTYNDFYGTSFGLNNIKSREPVKIRTKGSDDLLESFWGVGGNIGMGVLHMFTPMIGAHAEVSAAYRSASGETKMSVIVEREDDSSADPEKLGVSIEYTNTQINLDVPVMLRLAFGPLYVDLGAMPSINLSASSEVVMKTDNGNSSYEMTDGYELFEVAAVAGLGVHRRIGVSQMDLGLRMVLGLTAISDADDAPKTWQVQFNIAYWL